MAGGRDGAEAEALEKTTTWRGEAAVAMRLFAVGKVRGLDGGGELEALRQVDGCADLPARHLDVRHLAPETAHVREQRVFFSCVKFFSLFFLSFLACAGTACVCLASHRIVLSCTC